ncbi:MAG: plasmid stabilization system [Sulfurimonas sp.]|nr:MAG: plasmid stabilization system [Sulfurimonas sp.]
MYEIKYHPLVERDLKQLNNFIRIEFFKKIQKIQKVPELGQALGNKNGLNLTGLKKIYVAKKQIRIVYEIIENIIVVKVLAIGKRENMYVYKQAEQRR